MVRAATTSTTNITGFFIMRARVELGEGRADRRQDDLGIGQRRDRHPLAQIGGFHGCDSGSVAQNSVPAIIARVLDDRAEREGREEGEAADDQDDADQQADEQAAMGREACRSRPERSSSPRASRRSPAPG